MNKLSPLSHLLRDIIWRNKIRVNRKPIGFFWQPLIFRFQGDHTTVTTQNPCRQNRICDGGQLHALCLYLSIIIHCVLSPGSATNEKDRFVSSLNHTWIMVLDTWFIVYNSDLRIKMNLFKQRFLFMMVLRDHKSRTNDSKSEICEWLDWINCKIKIHKFYFISNWFKLMSRQSEVICSDSKWKRDEQTFSGFSNLFDSIWNCSHKSNFSKPNSCFSIKDSINLRQQNNSLRISN